MLYETVEYKLKKIPPFPDYMFAHFCICTITQILFIFVIVATEFELELLAYWWLASYIDLPTHIELN